VSENTAGEVDIAYQLKIHPRARHVRLRMDPRDGLIVTVPARFDCRRLPALLERRADWIEQAWRRQHLARAGLAPALLGSKPERIELAAMNRSWVVVYEAASGARLGLREQASRLVMRLPAPGSAQLDQRVAACLRRWLKRSASRFLSERVAVLAREHGFGYRNVQVRNQRARWGSCSVRGDLSLNARLLFCSPEACDYVLVHELVHTVHPDHSAAFWGRVAELVPDYRSLQDQLREVWLRLPDWV
jgi:predicted metal-dependent hydrolase